MTKLRPICSLCKSQEHPALAQEPAQNVTAESDLICAVCRGSGRAQPTPGQKSTGRMNSKGASSLADAESADAKTKEKVLSTKFKCKTILEHDDTIVPVTDDKFERLTSKMISLVETNPKVFGEVMDELEDGRVISGEDRQSVVMEIAIVFCGKLVLDADIKRMEEGGFMEEELLEAKARGLAWRKEFEELKGVFRGFRSVG